MEKRAFYMWLCLVYSIGLFFLLLTSTPPHQDTRESLLLTGSRLPLRLNNLRRADPRHSVSEVLCESSWAAITKYLIPGCSNSRNPFPHSSRGKKPGNLASIKRSLPGFQIATFLLSSSMTFPRWTCGWKERANSDFSSSVGMNPIRPELDSVTSFNFGYLLRASISKYDHAGS